MSAELDSLISSSEKYVFNLDSVVTEFIEPEIIFDDSFLRKRNSNTFLSEPTTCLLEKGKVYIVDSKLNSIMIFDSVGHFQNRVGQYGNAPSDFNKPFSIKSNNNYFFINDLKNTSIKIYNKNFKYQDAIKTNHQFFGRDYSITNENLIIPSIKYNEFDIYKINSNLNRFIKDTLITLPLFTQIKEHFILNNMSSVAIDDSLICYYYISAPFLLFTDNKGNVNTILQFQGTEISDFGKRMFNDQGGISIMFQDVIFKNNYIFIAFGRTILKVKMGSQYFSLTNKYSISEEFSISKLAIYRNSIYTCQWSEVRIIKLQIN
ncbi:MAG: hypothetical protein K9H48_21730 [Melioribacteraceae bacterium]|nr:hypothetical protein [Melioribacteraceae bacterium]